MNKPPQPIAGPPSVSHAAPSPGLSQLFYPNWPSLASMPRTVQPAHVYQNSQVVMIPQLQFSNSQGTAYFLPPGQYLPPYVLSAQQFPVASAPTSFYYVTYPDSSSAYGEESFVLDLVIHLMPSVSLPFFVPPSPGNLEASLVARERRGGGGRGSGRKNGRLFLHASPLRATPVSLSSS
ncbi:uncharacterized protein LOC143491325 [Brachyhypopomus gauderio]|uniref:uncharacterized protein LOC143491325 n=1 Tax=Brachyhypopomus gauderio TaxID=698409 RepID=UPI004042D42D